MLRRLALLLAISGVGLAIEGNYFATSTAVNATEEEATTTEASTRQKATPANIPEIKRAHQLGAVVQPSESEQPFREEPSSVKPKDVAEEFFAGEQRQFTNLTSKENMDTISMDDVNGESTNKAKDSESAQSAVSARNVSTSTPLIWEDTLPAEVTAVDPFATTVPSLLLSSTTLGTSTMQANVVTDETLLISHERTVDVIVTTVSPVSTLSTDGDLSTREEDLESFAPNELLASDKSHRFSLVTTKVEQRIALTTPLATTETVGIETSSIARIDISGDSDNKNDETIDEDLFVGDKSLFNQEQTMKALEKLTTMLNVTHERTQPSQPMLPDNFKVTESTHADRKGTESEVNLETRSTLIPASFSVGTPPTIIPVLVPKEPSPIDSEEGADAHGEGSVHSSILRPPDEAERGNSRLEQVSNKNSPTEFDSSDAIKKDDHHRVEEVGHIEPKPGSYGETQPMDKNEEETHGHHHDDAESVPEPTPKPEKELGIVRESSEGEEIGLGIRPVPIPTIPPKQEPRSSPRPEPEPASAIESTPSGGSGIVHSQHPHQPTHPADGDFKTPYSLRITSIDFTKDFMDPESGKSKKLRDQLIPDLEEMFGAIFTTSYQGVSIDSITKGSVIVDGHVYTSRKPDDIEQLATEFEQRVTAKGAQIGGNDVDIRSVSLNGFVSKNYVERIHEGYTSGSTPAYVIGGGITVGVVGILLVAFAVIAMNNRRANGTLKLKEESITMAETGRNPWNGTPSVNLMSYGNGHHQLQPNNGQSPMITTLTVNDDNTGR
uniref:SEA domain-containing protein n=1 Tax=Parascaris univalens TaxID=6257 RepID=A0A915BD54_PARUN